MNGYRSIFTIHACPRLRASVAGARHVRLHPALILYSETTLGCCNCSGACGSLFLLCPSCETPLYLSNTFTARSITSQGYLSPFQSLENTDTYAGTSSGLSRIKACRKARRNGSTSVAIHGSTSPEPPTAPVSPRGTRSCLSSGRERALISDGWPGSDGAGGDEAAC